VGECQLLVGLNMLPSMLCKPIFDYFYNNMLTSIWKSVCTFF